MTGDGWLAAEGVGEGKSLLSKIVLMHPSQIF